MGFIFKKKKGAAGAGKNLRTPKRASRDEATPRTTILNTQNGEQEDIEVLTPETKRAIQQREDIRKQLFSEGLDDEDLDEIQPSAAPPLVGLARAPSQAATSQSMEIAPDGTVLAAISEDEQEEAAVLKIPGADASPEKSHTSSEESSPPRQNHSAVGASSVSINSAIYRGPVSVDTPQRVLTKAGNPFDESMEKDGEGEDPTNLVNTSIEPRTPPRGTPQDSGDELSPHRVSSSSPPPIDLDETLADYSVSMATTANDRSMARDTSVVADVAERVMNSIRSHAENGQNAVDSMKMSLDELKKSRSVQKVMDLFYDTAARTSPYRSPKSSRTPKRPFYDETFTLRFIRRMTTKGAALLYLQAPGSPGNDTLDWKGRTVTMLLERGASTSTSRRQFLPRLEWTTVAGGQCFDVSTSGISLFDIMSISTSMDSLDEHAETKDEPDELCFFTITTNNGELYVFEANSTQERDSIVNGLKNVISRLAFHLVAGDVTASSELLDFNASVKGGAPGDLPSLANPRQGMNRLAHLMLD